jgi:hypothetical protein
MHTPLSFIQGIASNKRTAEKIKVIVQDFAWIISSAVDEVLYWQDGQCFIRNPFASSAFTSLAKEFSVIISVEFIKGKIPWPFILLSKTTMYQPRLRIYHDLAIYLLMLV